MQIPSLVTMASMGGDKLDIGGSLVSGAMAGAELSKQKQAQKAKAEIPGLLEKFKGGDDGALMQIAQYDPDLAGTLLKMEEAKQMEGVRGQQMEQTDLEMQSTQEDIFKKQHENRVKQLRLETASANGAIKALEGASEDQKTKIWDLYMASVEKQGIELPEELKGGYSPDKEAALGHIAEMGQMLIDDAEMTADMKNYMMAKSDPAYAEFLKTQNGGAGGGSKFMEDALLLQEEAKKRGKELSLPDAYSMAKSGLGKGITLDENNEVIPMAGIESTTTKISAADEQGKKDVQLEMDPLIEGAKKAAELDAIATADLIKRAKNSENSLEILDRANKILSQGEATGSGIGSGVAEGKAWFGISDDSTKANTELELLSGWLTSNVPRMEGPQSDFDVENYKKMAADVGNKKKPVGDRVAAIQGLMALHEKYAGAAATGDDGLPDDIETLQEMLKNAPD